MANTEGESNVDITKFCTNHHNKDETIVSHKEVVWDAEYVHADKNAEMVVDLHVFNIECL
jgi:hypothetical protein